MPYVALRAACSGIGNSRHTHTYTHTNSSTQHLKTTPPLATIVLGLRALLLLSLRYLPIARGIGGARSVWGRLHTPPLPSSIKSSSSFSLTRPPVGRTLYLRLYRPPASPLPRWRLNPPKTCGGIKTKEACWRQPNSRTRTDPELEGAQRSFWFPSSFADNTGGGRTEATTPQCHQTCRE